MKNQLHMLKSVTETICNSFIITTSDNKTIVIDGGFSSEKDYFLSYLKEVTKKSIPHIDAWFISHPHPDHAEVFYKVIEKHYDEITLDKVYLNFPSREFFIGNDAAAVKTVEEFYRLLPKFSANYRIVSGGDKFNIGNAHIHILYSPIFEIKGCNDASVVFRIDLGDRRILFLGDCGFDSGNRIIDLWRNSGALDADICQMAHHGQNGCGKELYRLIAPEVCLWCTPEWLWTNKNGTGCFKTLEVRSWMEELNVKTNYVMKDGTHVIEL